MDSLLLRIDVSNAADRACGGRRPAFRVFYQSSQEKYVVKLRLRENESVQDAVRRFRKLVEHSGVKREMRRREYYEKPSETKRRARRRAERRAHMARISGR